MGSLREAEERADALASEAASLRSQLEGRTAELEAAKLRLDDLMRDVKLAEGSADGTQGQLISMAQELARALERGYATRRPAPPPRGGAAPPPPAPGPGAPASHPEARGPPVRGDLLPMISGPALPSAERL